MHFHFGRLLIWEEYHYESLSSPVLPSISKMESPELLFDEWEGCWFSPESRISQLGAQSSDTVHLLINKMMMTNQVNIVGQGCDLYPLPFSSMFASPY